MSYTWNTWEIAIESIGDLGYFRVRFWFVMGESFNPSHFRNQNGQRWQMLFADKNATAH
jgi:hypothetical protein